MSEPIIGMRFGVLFFAGGVIPNPLDIRFQKVSGLSAEEHRVDALPTSKLHQPVGREHENHPDNRAVEGNQDDQKGFVGLGQLHQSLPPDVRVHGFGPSSQRSTEALDLLHDRGDDLRNGRPNRVAKAGDVSDAAWPTLVQTPDAVFPATLGFTPLVQNPATINVAHAPKDN